VKVSFKLFASIGVRYLLISNTCEKFEGGFISHGLAKEDESRHILIREIFKSFQQVLNVGVF